MVADFLRKMNKHYEEEVTRFRDNLSHLETQQVENDKFMELLESESQKVFSDFTPREVDNKNRRKIKELQATRDELNEQIARQKAALAESEAVQKEIRTAMQEVRELEMAAEDSKWFEANVYDAGDENEEPSQEKLSDEVASKLETILSFLLADPMRAKQELEKLLK